MNKETQSVQPDAGSGGDALADAARRVLCEIDSGDFDGEVSQAAYAALRAALAARRPPAQGGTVTGWRMIDGVTVFDVASCSGIVEPQQFVRYADYLAARQPVGVEPVGYWFTDDPAKFAMPGSGFHPGAEPPVDAINVVPVYLPASAAVPMGLQDIIGSMLNYAGVADTCEVTQGHAPVAIRNWAEMLQELAWPAAVPVDDPLTGKYAAVLRPFFAMMARELHANAGKGDRPGWLSMDRKTALLEIYHHIGKLQRATKNADEPGIAEYAADVANMAMMLVDVCGLLQVDDATQPQPAAAEDSRPPCACHDHADAVCAEHPAAAGGDA